MSKKNTPQESHISLYRKYRPVDFKDVVDQDHVVSVLEQSIKDGLIGHAYLFHGSRGTGKTSIARIFARAIGTTQNDLYEIDAASNTSVDDIRALTEAVNTVPLESKYKVYILDEVHMLSKAAFNAFLKTLEEPPKHVIFILATTEIERIPETILSRCEVYTFKKPTVDILTGVVQKVSKSEGYTIDASGAELVALLGDGSFRDTLSTLQKVISASKGTSISREFVEEITNAPKSTLVNGFTEALLRKDAQKAIEHLHLALSDSIDVKLFSQLCLERLRSVLLVQIQAKSGVDIKEIDSIKKTVEGIPAAHTASVIKKILEIQYQIGKTYIPILPLEVVVGEICV
ncbi:MAG: DNA polymerase III subunit gamma/tau [Candidatus Taylorbacteria bacterium]|nr:DNA polymerase III subunit gamma/tau [Candidatus Taylorbacteria bacterium]